MRTIRHEFKFKIIRHKNTSKKAPDNRGNLIENNLCTSRVLRIKHIDGHNSGIADDRGEVRPIANQTSRLSCIRSTREYHREQLPIAQLNHWRQGRRR
jgi:hypothetical protein